MSGVNLTFTLFGKDASASRALKSVGDESEHTHGKLGKLGGMGKGVGLAIAGGVGLAAGAVAAAVPVMVGLGKAAAEDEKSADRLARTLTNTTDATRGQISATEAWISKQGQALGVTDDQLRPALGRLVTSTKDVSEAQDLASLAMDASAGTGKSLETVANTLARAHDGNVGALARLGVQTKDAEGKTLSFDQITKNMADTFGGQAAGAADTLEGKMGRLSLAFAEGEEAIGANLLPVGEKLADFALNKLMPALGDLGDKVMPVLRDAWDKISAAFEDARPGLEQLGDVVMTVGKAFIDHMLPVLVKVEGFIVGNLLKALGWLGSHLDEIGVVVLRMVGFVVGGFENFYRVATGVLEGILTVAEKTLGWIPGIGDKIAKAKEGFSSFRDHTLTKIADVKAGIEAASRTLDNYDANARKERVAQLKADISDAKSKIAEAKEKLNDPDLTKDRRAELKAEIASLKANVREAKSEIASVGGKTVTIGVNVVVDGKTIGYKRGNGPTQPIGKISAWASGGLVRGAGTGTSDSIAAMLSNGEYVTRAATVARLGSGFFDALDAGYVPAVAGRSGGGDLHVHFDNPIIGSREDLARYLTEAQLEYKRARGGVALRLS